MNLVDVTSITTFLSGLTDNLKTIGLAIAIIAVIALAILLITGGSQGLQKSKGMAISILVGIIVLALGTSIVQAIYQSM